MTDRDKLIELFNAIEKDAAITCPHYKTDKTCDTCKYTINNFMCNHTERTVDYLLANGVIVPPCKVGDTLWVVWSLTKSSKKYVYPVRVYALRYDDKKNNMRVCTNGEFKIESYDGYYTHYYRGTFPQENIGKTVFLTKEEAEKALEERKSKNA